MTNGKQISDPRPTVGVAAIEAALRDVHEAKFTLQRLVDELDAARSDAVSDALAFFMEGPAPPDLDDPHNAVRWEFGEGRSEPAADGLSREDLVASIEAYLDTGTLPEALPRTVENVHGHTAEIMVARVDKALAAIARDYLLLRDGRSEDLRRLVAGEVQAWDRAADLLRQWVAEESNNVTEDFGRVLRAWRTALLLAGNIAADILGVSPPTVTRYERGSRSPSRPYVEAMVERIVRHGPNPDPRAADMINLARMLGTTGPEILDFVERQALQEHNVRERIDQVLDRRSLAELELLLRLAASPDALAVLHGLGARDELAPLRAALARDPGDT